MIEPGTVTEFFVEHRERPRTGGSPRRVGLAPWQARCVQGYIAANLHSTVRIMDLARVVQFGRQRFNRAFKAWFGCTPYSYVISRRVERARYLMIVSNDSLSQISTECGFADQFHLSNLFLRIVGKRPAAWRRLNATGHL